MTSNHRKGNAILTITYTKFFDIGAWRGGLYTDALTSDLRVTVSKEMSIPKKEFFLFMVVSSNSYG